MILVAKAANCGACPLWGVEVSIAGLYASRSDGSWMFVRSECPIINNSKRHIYEQDERYKYMRCTDPFACPLYTKFQPSITSDK